MRVGLVGAGHMGAALGWSLKEGGDDVVTSLKGRSQRTKGFANTAGLRVLADLDALLSDAQALLVVVPPTSALSVASAIAQSAERTANRPLVVDLNSVSPGTALEIADVLSRSGLDLVAGSISGPPPWVRPGAHLYFSGSRSPEIVGLSWRHVEVHDLGPSPTAAKALKMSTASVYKGLVALFIQAMRMSEQEGVLDETLADLRTAGYDMLDDVVVAAAKSARYVTEMREIATTQSDAGLDSHLFETIADVWAGVATSRLARDADPESAHVGQRSPSEIVSLLAPGKPRP